MEIPVGAEVVDTNGRTLGSVDHVVRNVWTGDIDRFVVIQRDEPSDLFFTPTDVVGATETKVTVRSNENAV